MIRLQLDDRPRESDLVRSRSGDAITVRFARPRDAEAVQAYVRSLSPRTRGNRFLGAISELPQAVLDEFTHPGVDHRFSVVATTLVEGFEIIIGEARYALDTDAAGFEFGLSLQDRWQGRGIGAALLNNLECRAAALGAISMFADTLRSNEAMIALARKSGYAFVRHPDDWRLLRFEKRVAYAPAQIPCTSWRPSAQARQATVQAGAGEARIA